MFKLENGKEYLYQWDINQRVILESVEAGTEVHFCLSGVEDTALIVFCYEENGTIYANIPNIHLQQFGYINCYVYVKTEDKGYTKAQIIIRVNKRAKPADYVYTETEVITFETLVKQVNEAVKHAEAVAKELEDIIASGDYRGEAGYTPVKGVDYWTKEDKQEIQDYIDEQLAEMNATISDLRKLVIEKNPFSVDLTTAKDLVTNKAGTAYFMTLDTYGDNWRVSAETTPSAVTLNANNETKMRYFKDTDNGTFFRAMTPQKDYVFDFTASIGGTYTLAVKSATADSGGYADVYVNDNYVGYINTYSANSGKTAQYFYGVELKSGNNANKIKIVPRKAEEYRNLVSIISFDFKAPTS